MLQLRQVVEDSTGEVRARLLATVVRNMAIRPGWCGQLGPVLGSLPEASGLLGCTMVVCLYGTWLQLGLAGAHKVGLLDGRLSTQCSSVAVVVRSKCAVVVLKNTLSLQT